MVLRSPSCFLLPGLKRLDLVPVPFLFTLLSCAMLIFLLMPCVVNLLGVSFLVGETIQTRSLSAPSKSFVSMFSQQNKSLTTIFHAETLLKSPEVLCNLLSIRFDDIAIKQPKQLE
jgi:hypothetical protein